jgi:2-polyprenyl-3-methyl-5-hydroxy-6-metoxy-1,4-benzoquinol methylase
MPAGHEGWGAYAPFYDWENTRTMGRRDLAFWRQLAKRTGGRVLELGSGTGRLTVPLHRHGIQVFGVSVQDAASHTAFIEKHKAEPFFLYLTFKCLLGYHLTSAVLDTQYIIRIK